MLNAEHLIFAEDGLKEINKAVQKAIEDGIPAPTVALLLLGVAQLHVSIVAARSEADLVDEVCALKLAFRELIDHGRLRVEARS
jgi:hypothetical protein